MILYVILGNIVYLSFQNILKLGNEAHKHGLDHSTAGGRMILELAKDRQTAEFLNTVIYFHHGLGD